MKKQVFFLLAALLAIGQSAFAYDFSAISPSGHTLYYSIRTDGSGVNVVWPNSSATTASETWTGYTKPTGALIVPNTVTYNNTTYVVRRLGTAFFECTGLTSVVLSDSIREIANTFSGCTGLTSVTLGSHLTTIGNSAFYDCSSLSSINIPNTVTYIGTWAFRGTTNLTSINIPNAIDTIRTGTFVLSGLTSVTIPSSVECIMDRAFGWCNNLTSVNIPNSVDSIGRHAFYLDSNLTSITIPNGVTAIGALAFHSCVSLTSVTLPSSVTWIGMNAFAECNALRSANYTGTIAQWCGIVFESACANPTSSSLALSINGTRVTDLVIPNSVTTIGNYAFFYCSGLNSVTIGSNVTSIGDYAFMDCVGLTAITIPSSVTTIGNGAFSDCSGLTSVTIGSGVTSIGEYAFNTCLSLTSVTIPNSVTSIGSYAFQNCRGLTSVTIGSGVTSIGEYAFDGCTQIADIHMRGNTPPTVQSNTFYEVPTTATLYVPCGAATAYASTYPWNQFNIADFAYSFSATTSDITRGTVQVIHAPECTNLQAEMQANPYHGFHFVRWSDGNTEAHRYLVVVQDTVLQAEFAEGNVGIDDIEADDIRICSADGRIVVEGVTDEVHVFDMMGRSVRNNALPAGVYMVKVSDYPARKVVVVR